MNILVILNGFFPGEKYGGPPVSINNFCTLMSDHNCYIVTKNHDFGSRKPYDNIKDGWNKRDNCRVLYLSDSMFNETSFSKVIDDVKPSIIYLQSFFERCVFLCLKAAKKKNCKVLLAPRGELCEGAIEIKKYKKIPYIIFMRSIGLLKDVHFQTTSDDETQGILKRLKIDRKNIHFLNNIPSLPEKEYVYVDKKTGRGRFIFLSRIHQKKNLLSAIKYLSRIKGNAVFDIYGPIEDDEYWKECQEAIGLLPDNVKVEYKGLVSHERVHDVFNQYDAFLFPTLSENYGHVIAESLSAGTPVITSNQTPWIDLREYNAGWAISLSDDDGFIAAIQYIIDQGNNFAEMRRCAKEYFRLHANIQQLKDQYENTIYSIVNG